MYITKTESMIADTNSPITKILMSTSISYTDKISNHSYLWYKFGNFQKIFRSLEKNGAAPCEKNRPNEQEEINEDGVDHL